MFKGFEVGKGLEYYGKLMRDFNQESNVISGNKENSQEVIVDDGGLYLVVKR